jgi:FKBP-type peptidyl-prolyl cis-trans isomerase FkpA
MRQPALAAILLAVLSACATRQVSLQDTVFGPDAEVVLAAMTLHERGFYYRDVAEGTGDAATAGSTVMISYVVRLADGTLVDQTPSGANMSITLGTGGAIRGLELGMRGMRVGGVRQLVIPPDLAYGATRTGAVPPNSVLVMLVRLDRLR